MEALAQAINETEKVAAAIPDLSPTWGLVEVTLRAVYFDEDTRHGPAGIIWFAEAVYGKGGRASSRNGRRSIKVCLWGNRPLRALERLRQVCRNPKRYVRDHSTDARRGCDVSRPDGWPFPYRFTR